MQQQIQTLAHDALNAFGPAGLILLGMLLGAGIAAIVAALWDASDAAKHREHESQPEGPRAKFSVAARRNEFNVDCARADRQRALRRIQ